MILERLKRVCNAIRVSHSKVVTWHVGSETGKKLTIEGEIDKILYEAISETLMKHGFESIDWCCKLGYFEMTVRDVT